MSDVQLDAYENADAVYSDPFGLIPRDNRNHRKKQTLILDATHAHPGDSVLEVGCGDGIHATRYAANFDYTGIDLSPSLVESTRRRLDGAGLDGRVVEANALETGFPDDHFNAVVGTAILHHVHPHRKALREWRRITKPGGSITLMEPNYLFPKEIIETHVLPEERHKVNMAPWRLPRILDAVAGVLWRHEPAMYTPPWPKRLHGFYDRVDDVMPRVPVLRWMGMMQLVHGEVEL